MVDVDHAQRLLGARVVDADGSKVGTVNEVYVDDNTGTPSWVTVSTGWFGMSESFVPLARAEFTGEEIRVPFDKATIKDAPRFDGGEPLSRRDEDDLYGHYAISPGASVAERAVDTSNDSFDYPDIVSSGSDPDQSLIRWEEQTSVRPGSYTEVATAQTSERLDAGTERVQSGQARLRKYVVTEQQTVTVPVSHEEVRIERFPLTNTDREGGSTDAELGEQEYAIVLHAERPVVTTEVVAVERIQLDAKNIAGNEAVSGAARKERVAFSDVDTPGTPDNEDRSGRTTTPRFGGHR